MKEEEEEVEKQIQNGKYAKNMPSSNVMMMSNHFINAYYGNNEKRWETCTFMGSKLHMNVFMKHENTSPFIIYLGENIKLNALHRIKIAICQAPNTPNSSSSSMNAYRLCNCG